MPTCRRSLRSPFLCQPFGICFQACVTAVVRGKTELVTVRTAKKPIVSVHDRER